MSNTSTSAAADTAQAKVVIERTYRARVQDLWELWTTKAGFESWWGPEGFRVEVHALEARPGGALEYDMIADAPDMIAAMKQMGQPLSHGTRGRFAEWKPLERLKLVHVIDFIRASSPTRARSRSTSTRRATRHEWWSRCTLTATRNGRRCRSRASRASSRSSTSGSTDLCASAASQSRLRQLVHHPMCARWMVGNAGRQRGALQPLRSSAPMVSGSSVEPSPTEEAP